MAKKYGLKYNVEFLPWAGVRNLQEAITLVDTVKADNLYIMVDTLHAGRAGVTGAELARTDPKYFNFIHLCDGPAGPDGDPVLDNIKDELMLFTAREGRLYPGEGAMEHRRHGEGDARDPPVHRAAQPEADRGAGCGRPCQALPGYCQGLL